ncbi:MAG: tetratricopeptide repeat protein [Cyanobacteria bacterium J06554_3]
METIALGVGLGLLTFGALPANAAAPTDRQIELLESTTEAIPLVSSQASEADQLAARGVQTFTRQDYVGAFEAWQQAMMLYRIEGDRTKEARMLENLSVVYRVTDRPGEAINASQQAVDIYEALGTANEQPSAFLNLGSAYRLGSQINDAIAAYETSLSLYQNADDPTGERIILSLLADVHKDAENYIESITYQEQVLSIAQSTQNAQIEAESLSDRESVV